MHEDEIARHLEQARASGELRAAPSYGKPLAEIEGWDATPEELRMPFKVMKDAGLLPPEVALFHERAQLTAEANAAAGPEKVALQRKLAELEQKIALRLEALRTNRSL